MIYPPPPDEDWVAVSGDTLFLADLSGKTFAAGDVGMFGVPGGLAPSAPDYPAPDSLWGGLMQVRYKVHEWEDNVVVFMPPSGVFGTLHLAGPAANESVGIATEHYTKVQLYCMLPENVYAPGTMFAGWFSDNANVPGTMTFPSGTVFAGWFSDNANVHYANLDCHVNHDGYVTVVFSVLVLTPESPEAGNTLTLALSRRAPKAGAQKFWQNFRSCRETPT